MKRLATVILAIVAYWTPAARAAGEPAPAGDRMAAFREAKFGMFIHWGLYAIPARGEWVMNKSKIPVAKYAEYARQFNPVKFEAEQWVRVAKEAGMRYIVITSKHHDGFAMFGSKTSPYNIVDATPFKRDPLKELAAACQKHGIRLGFYYSQAQDWHHPGGAASGGRWDPAQQGDFQQYLMRIAMPQVKELLTGYGPVFAIWFDTPVQMSRQRAEEFARLVHATQPATYINSRLFHSGRSISGLGAEKLDELKQIGVDYLSYGDRQIPDRPQWPDWETCMTLNHSWGYNKNDHNWKAPETLVRQLVEIASKGGNFLLNVGPTAEGEIPAPSVENLKVVGRWLKINGEAIYGAGPSPFSDNAVRVAQVVPAAERVECRKSTGSTKSTKGTKSGTSSKKRSQKQETAASSPRGWWCTTQPGKLYIHLFQWPAGQFDLSGVKGKVTKAYLLVARDKPLAATQTGDRVTVTLPPQAPDPIATVLCLEHEGG